MTKNDNDTQQQQKFSISRGIFYYIITAVVIFVVIPALICLVIGIVYINSECNIRAKQTVDLATWLIVTGLTGLLGALVIIAISVNKTFFPSKQTQKPECHSEPLFSGSLYWLMQSLFLMAWFLVGITYVKRNHENCKDDNPALYGIAIFGLIFSLAWVFVPVFVLLVFMKK